MGTGPGNRLATLVMDRRTVEALLNVTSSPYEPGLGIAHPFNFQEFRERAIALRDALTELAVRSAHEIPIAPSSTPGFIPFCSSGLIATTFFMTIFMVPRRPFQGLLS